MIKRINDLARYIMEEFPEGRSYDVFNPSLCSKSLDCNFLYQENVYFYHLFLEGGISINVSQVGIQRKASITSTKTIIYY